MNVPPLMLLLLGSFFALLYGFVITFGWALTRRNRKIYQKEMGIQEIPLYDILKREKIEGKFKKCISLSYNQFLSPNNEIICISEYNAYIATGKSSEFPQISEGNLILLDKVTREIKFCFDIPDLEDYR